MYIATVARSQNGMSENFAGKFCQMRKNSAFFAKICFTALNDKNSMKMLCLEIFPQKKF
jgi:hypothetical protein